MAPAMRVRDVMTTEVRTVRPDTPVKDVARTMHEARVSGVPVVDDEGRLVGIVTEADLLLLEEEPPALRGRRRSFLDGTAGGVTQTYVFNQSGSPCDSIQHVGQGYFNGPNGGYVS